MVLTGESLGPIVCILYKASSELNRLINLDTEYVKQLCVKTDNKIVCDCFAVLLLLSSRKVLVLEVQFASP